MDVEANETMGDGTCEWIFSPKNVRLVFVAKCRTRAEARAQFSKLTSSQR